MAPPWESLLAAAPDGEDLYFVSSDSDYSSDLDDERFDPFLAEEWEATKKSRVIYFKRLSLFFRAQFPEIKLAAEAEKDLAIRDLADRGYPGELAFRRGCARCGTENRERLPDSSIETDGTAGRAIRSKAWLPPP